MLFNFILEIRISLDLKKKLTNLVFSILLLLNSNKVANEVDESYNLPKIKNKTYYYGVSTALLEKVSDPES